MSGRQLNTIALNAPNTKLLAALSYAQQGIPVFPLQPNDKRPLLHDSWVAIATTDEDIIRQWWSQYPDANIAGVMGARSGLLASDLDRKGGQDGWTSYQAILPGDVTHPIQQTPSGGYHILHGYIPGLINFTHKGSSGGIDMRTDNGYIVLAPSTIDGVPYQWIQGGEIKKLNGQLGEQYLAWSVEPRVHRDVDMPEPTPIEDLKPLEDQPIAHRHQLFLQHGEVDERYNGDRSAAILGAASALYRLGLSDGDVLGYLENSYAMEVAQEHRIRGDATAWLWEYSCTKARGNKPTEPDISVEEAFASIPLPTSTDSAPVEMSVLPKETPEDYVIRQAKAVRQGDHRAAVLVYAQARAISNTFAKNLIKHECRSDPIGSYAVGDLERDYKDYQRDQRREMADRNRTAIATGDVRNNPLNWNLSGAFQTWDDFNAHFIYVASENRWYNRWNGMFLPPDSMNNHYGHLAETLGDAPSDAASVVQLLKGRSDALKVDSRTYWPGITQEIIYGEDNTLCLNNWKPSRTQTKVQALIAQGYRVTDEMVGPFLTHAIKLIPDAHDRNLLLDYMAYVMQHQDVKVNHAALIGGAERVGKDTLVEPFRTYLGPNNYRDIEADALGSQFDDHFIDVKAVFIQEIHQSATRDAIRVENKLKPMQAAPPDYIDLKRKGQPDYRMLNRIQMVLFTNYRDAIHISEEGSRYLCIWSPMQRERPEYYQWLYHWMDNLQGWGLTGREVAAMWLMQRDVSAFDPKMPAPTTSWREYIQGSSQSDLESEIRDTLEHWYESGKDLFTPVQLFNKLVETDPTRKFKVSTVTRALNGMRVGQIPSVDRNRFHVPKVFNEPGAFPVTPSSFKEMTKSAIYCSDLSLRGDVHRWDDDRVGRLMHLCPGHMKAAYQDVEK